MEPVESFWGEVALFEEEVYSQYLLNDDGETYTTIKEGDIALVELPQSAAGVFKIRPALVLKKLPNFDDFLVCGISSQKQHYVEDFDELLEQGTNDFVLSGLHKSSVIRLSALAVFSSTRIMRSIGSIQGSLHKILLARLSRFLLA